MHAACCGFYVAACLPVSPFLSVRCCLDCCTGTGRQLFVSARVFISQLAGLLERAELSLVRRPEAAIRGSAPPQSLLLLY